MFDIKIGTIVPWDAAAPMIRQLNEKGFESYELTFEKWTPDGMDFDTHAREVLDAAEGRPIDTVGFYGNTLTEEVYRKGVAALIDHAHDYGATTVACFAGADPSKNVPDNIPLFAEVFGELCRHAEAAGVKLAIENCGGGWFGGSHNIGFCEEAWNLMFDAVTSDALALEWEPCHAMSGLVEPIPQLRRWAKKIAHIHGKDGHIAWDVIRDHGVRGIVPYFESRTPGFGDTDWNEIFTILIRAGYEGYCDIEGYHDIVHYDDNEWSAQITALDYLKRCRGGISYYAGPEEYRGYRGRRKR